MIGVRPAPWDTPNALTLKRWIRERKIGVDWTRGEVIIWRPPEGRYENLKFTEPVEHFPSDQLIAEVALALRSLK